MNKAKGFYLAGRLLEDILQIIMIELTRDKKAALRISVMVGNMLMQNLFRTKMTDFLIRNAINMSAALFEAVCQVIKVVLKVSWIEGKSIPADIGSKVNKNPVKEADSILWRKDGAWLRDDNVP